MKHLPSPGLLLFLLLIPLSCADNDRQISPTLNDITESVYASGVIRSRDQYQVYSKVVGNLETIHYKEGSRIRKGDILFSIDNKALDFAAKNAEIAATTSDYNTNRDKLLDALQSIEVSRSALVHDSIMLDRQKLLWNQQIGSRAELEQAELRYENSRKAMMAAQVRYEDLDRQLQLVSRQSKNNLEIARLSGEDRNIRSRISGVVYKIFREPGELVNNGSPLAVVGGEDFLAELSIDEFDIVKIKAGQKVIIRMDSYESEIFEATLVSIDPMMDERTRTFKAEASFTEAPESLFPNLTLEANIVIQVKKDVLTIPRNYLQNDSTVILGNGDFQKVETGLKDYQRVEILEGLTTTSKIKLPTP